MINPSLSSKKLEVRKEEKLWEKRILGLYVFYLLQYVSL